MRVLKTVAEVRDHLQHFNHIGFVPTMGALHDGHLSLIKRAKEEEDVVVCSIFVNPTQFNDAVDFEKYPRHEEEDLRLLEAVGCDVVFLPSFETVYPEPDRNQYEFGPLAATMEGEKRPGHFNGVASVVKRLFEIVRPEKAYFGLKDYQQYLIVKRMTKDFGLNVEVVGCPTVREASGLARSSRNERLDARSTKLAEELYRSLDLVRRNSEGKSSAELESLGRRYLDGFPEIEVEYFKVVDPASLDVPRIDDGSVPRRALVAAFIGGIRLIDNMEI